MWYDTGLALWHHLRYHLQYAFGHQDGQDMEKEKVHENKLRRMAQRQGLILQKSRRRDPNAHGYGLYALIDAGTGGVVHPAAPWGPHTMTLDDVENWLTSD